ncbi:MAG TPA: pyrimidine/purine nucleoside phosphorylase [Thioalkalivibrio sp.]|nr:pyrimidine/purine nucleoside phosphorylase [Thioalkalivibrio sp.]
MFKVNEYFDGKGKSIAFTADGGPATVGVMAAGEYEFGTSQVEHMTLVSGQMAVQLPNEPDWRAIGVGETFVVPANVTFGVRIDEEASYLCLYK